MKQSTLLVLVLALALGTGCSSIGTWQYVKLRDIPVDPNVPGAASCSQCHEAQFATWSKTEHADPKDMEDITVPGLKECGACHDNLAAHVQDPSAAKPQDIAAMDKAAQNQVCGKCHYNKELFGRGAINPHHKHGMYKSVGFEGKDVVLSCLDCHQGHGDRSDMLTKLRAHLCFDCHSKRTYATMGIFQPVNYIAAGKLCISCHAPHGTTLAGNIGRTVGTVAASCVVCHPTGL